MNEPEPPSALAVKAEVLRCATWLLHNGDLRWRDKIFVREISFNLLGGKHVPIGSMNKLVRLHDREQAKKPEPTNKDK